ncbi:CPBP family intramembrane metalloprotease [Gloeocapsopsis crepidinum LEGE 06123]|uniref:CPBP family intramembrane metalloprotease n=1 Tax=Gloeocapsopsis crepidinum LEGE 06123 TaxID=588587 RepID=A0ABR9UWA2_9CHRO|nr:CPBP family intramembrane glutamic endopeptidase [Gloeocapsopsis crepidinum]MBE9192305.1 CPBP family intramembrane metalloprotease [Gloeocapsopsis crepidinum LEGE 06123]
MSLLQVISFFLTWAGCWLPIAILLAIARGWQIGTLEPAQKLPLLGSLYLLAPIILWIASLITNSSFRDYGLVWNFAILRSLSVGLAIGVLSLIILFAIQTILGWVKWQKISAQQITSVVLPTLALALWVSATEELIFRGFVLTQLQQDYTLAIAAIGSSVIFAVLHLVWEQRETVPQLFGLWLMGIVLVLARLVDGGSLGLAWGLHSGWVWAIASIDTAGILTYTGKAPEWVTGKYGKPLAGMLGIFLLLATGGILWLSGNC